MKQTRGALTRRVDDKAKELLGRSITLPELRLMPYIFYVMLNERRIDRAKVNDDEKAILDKWQAEGLITSRRAFFSLNISKKFYDAISEIQWLAYVDIEEE